MLTFVDNAVNYAESVHSELNAFNGTVLNSLVLLIEIIIESRPIMPSITSR